MTGGNHRGEESQHAHDIATSLIARHRFGIDDWDVAINPALEENVAVEGAEVVAYPDIVARDASGVIAIGEIETADSISEEAAAQWRKFGELCPRMYLFVPEGTEQAVVELLDNHSICCAGLRTYSLDEDGGVEVESVHIVNGHPPKDDHPWWSRLGAD